MGTVRIGGDPEQYMDPPSLTKSSGDGSAGSFLAILLDAIGIGRQVVKGPKESKLKSGKDSAPAKQEAAAAAPIDVLGMVSQAIAEPATQTGTLTPFGQKWMDSVAPILTFDPGASKVKRM